MAKDIDELRAAIADLSSRIPDNVVRIFTADEVEKVKTLSALLGDIEVLVQGLGPQHVDFVVTLERVAVDEDGNNVIVPIIKQYKRKKALMSYWPWGISAASIVYGLWQGGVLNAVVQSVLGGLS